MTKSVTNTNTNTTANVIAVPKKRGRKSKAEVAAVLENIQIQENINVIIEETSTVTGTENLLNADNFFNSEEENKNLILDENKEEVDTNLIEDTKPVAKKRGRKPKGGKIIQQIVPINNNKEVKPNVILHLKCSLKDLHLNNMSNSDIQGFDFKNSTKTSYELMSIESDVYNNNNTNTNTNTNNLFSQNLNEDEMDNDYDKLGKDNDIKEIWKKLKVLEHNLHVNNISDKKSACFWCTYDFDNPPVYIPKHYIKDSYNVYGCFCSPECASAYLMEENIDSSSKFERYYLINHIYSQIYDYKKNIKPAPNPYYMLEKYYGNLTIQEYRALLRSERLFLIVYKTLTRILPELHEDNDDFIINNKIIPSNTYHIKKKIQKKQNKTNILSEKFGLSQ